MKRFFSLFFLIVLIMLCCSGCWDRRELDDLSIVAAVGFDLDDEGYRVTLQIVNAEEVTKNARGYDTPVTIYEETGKTVMESIRKMTKQMPRKAYFAHLRLVVIGEELAEEGFVKILDFLSRDHEMRADFYFIVAKDVTANETLSILTSLEQVPANKLFHSLQNTEKSWGSTVTIDIDDLLWAITAAGKEPVLPGLIVTGPPKEGEVPANVATTKEPASLHYNGLGIFRRDKLIGWLNDTDSRSYNFIQSEIKNTVIDNVSCQGGYLGIELFRSRTKVKGFVENGQPKIEIRVKSWGNIGDVECEIDLTKMDQFMEAQHGAEKELQREIEDVIKRVQKEYKADIFGFGEAIRKADHKYWDTIKDDWDQYFEHLNVDVKVNIQVVHKSTIQKRVILNKED